MIAANRTRKSSYEWAEEYCGVIHCPLLKNLNECTKITSNSDLQSKFLYAKLTAEVGDSTLVYPSAVGSKHKLLSQTDWKFDNKLSKGKKISTITVGSKDNPKARGWHLSTLGLYGRDYSRDPPYIQKPLAKLVGV